MVNPVLPEQQDKGKGQGRSCRGDELGSLLGEPVPGAGVVQACARRGACRAPSDPRARKAQNHPHSPCQTTVELIMLIICYQKRRCCLCSELLQTSCLRAAA